MAKKEADEARHRSVRVTAEYASRQILHASFVKVSRLGDDFYLDVGFIEPESAIAALQTQNGDDPVPVSATVTHRFGMSAETFRRLRHSTDEFIHRMKEQGQLEKLGLADLDPDKS